MSVCIKRSAECASALITLHSAPQIVCDKIICPAPIPREIKISCIVIARAAKRTVDAVDGLL